jgi:hypothetical protein
VNTIGFRLNSYAKIWEIEPVSDTITKLRISISRKNKHTDEYEQDFSGYVACFGTAAASSAARLKKGDVIKLGECDVSTKYDAEKKVTYTNYKLFDFEKVTSNTSKANSDNDVDGGEPEIADLPF